MAEREHNGKLNNSGSAMVMVIMAIALVSILVAVIMIMTTMNLQMKYTERQAKKNFYSAEKAMEEIRAGLELDVSAAASSAYYSVLHTYGQEDMNDSERIMNFRIKYIGFLKNRLQDGASAGNYKLSTLEGYVDQDQFSAGNFKLYSPTGCKMESLTKGLYLRDVRVEYTDAEGYLSKVYTDFALLIPDLQFSQSRVMPDFFDYSIIADKGITGTNTGNVRLAGGVYAGENGILVKGASSVWQFANMNRMICKETLKLEERARLTVNPEVNLWAGGITADSASASFLGRTYVADDLNIKGKNSTVTLQNEYYGYGDGTELLSDGNYIQNKNLSSAMLLNGTGSTLDMTKLNKLVLSGRANIATGGSEVTPPAEDNPALEGIVPGANENIPLGESIGIKSNQIAYLVPPECIGIFNEEAVIGKNPMSSEDYKRLVACKEDTEAFPDFEEVSGQVTVNKLGKPLNDYSTGDGVKFQKIFQQLGNEIIVYYYLVLDEQNAVKYFSDYYEAEKARLDSYMKKYTNKLLLNDLILRLVIDGNTITYDGEAVSFHKNDNTFTSEELNGLQEEHDSYAQSFTALNSKLQLNYSELSKEEKEKRPFENLLNTGEITGTITPQLTLDDGRILSAVVTDGNYSYGASSPQGLCLIIAKGNVTINKNFSGLIFAGEKVTVMGPATIKGNRDDLIKMLQYKVSTDKTIIQKYFKDGDNYVLEGTVIAPPEKENTQSYLNLTDYVQYENWKKE